MTEKFKEFLRDELELPRFPQRGFFRLLFRIHEQLVEI